MDKLLGKRIAVLLLDEAPDEQVNWMRGTVIRAEGQLLVDCGGGAQIPLNDEQLSRIRTIDSEDLREVFEDAEFLLPLLVGPMPDGAQPDNFTPLGLRLPQRDA